MLARTSNGRFGNVRRGGRSDINASVCSGGGSASGKPGRPYIHTSSHLPCGFYFTVLFANFATALAEARGKAQADSLRKARRDTLAYRLTAVGTIEQIFSTD